jgi:carboxypeptidase T
MIDISMKRRESGFSRTIAIALISMWILLGAIPFVAHNSQTQEVRGEPSLYHTYEEMVEELQIGQANHSSIMRMYSLGTTEGDRTIWAVKISDNVQANESEEPEVLFMAGQKANSLISVEIALYLVTYLTDNYGRNDEVTGFVNEREIWILPLLNPDGHAFIDNETTEWEKNLKDNGDGQTGVNLDRNYGYEFGVDANTHNESSSQFYHGESPFSEKETQAVRDFVESHGFVFSLTLSSPGETITYPWGYTNSSTQDDALLNEIAGDMALYSGYDVKQGGKHFPTHGNSDDWLYHEASLLPFTIFVGSDDIPEESQIESLAETHLPACLYLLDIADDPNRALVAEWTFMVYMGGDGPSNLDEEGVLDINEMEEVGSNPYLNILVQFDRAVGGLGTKRYLVERDYDTDQIHSQVLGDIGEIDMASPQTLLAFVNWSITNYPAEHYFLDLWGHGKGWVGVTLDEGNSLSMSDIKSVLPKFKDRIDVVGFDNCNMAMIEVYTTFLGQVDYIVGSEKEEDALGWPYDRIFRELEAEPELSPEDFSIEITEHYIDWAKGVDETTNTYNSSYSATISVIDMDYLDEVIEKADVLALELNRTMALFSDEINRAIDETEDYQRQPTPHDLYHFAELVEEYVPTSPVRIAAQNLRDAIDTMVVAEEHNTKDGRIVVDNAHGISVWLYDDGQFSTYQTLDFAKMTHWDEFLAASKNPPPSPHVPFDMVYTILDSDEDANNDTIDLSLTAGASGLKLTIEVRNYEGEEIMIFNESSTTQGTVYDYSFNPEDYGHPSDNYYFYAYLTDEDNFLQNYSEVVDIWLGNEKPDVVLKSVKFFRADGMEVGGDTGKKPIDGENTLIVATIANEGNIALTDVKIQFLEGNDVLKTEQIKLTLDQKKNVTFHWLAEAGSGDIRVVVDGDNDIKEANETNNAILEILEVKPNTPISSLTIKGKVRNIDKIDIVGAKVQIRNMRTNMIINKTTTDNGFSVELEPSWFLEGDRVDVSAEYNSVSSNLTVYTYSEDEEVIADITLNTEVYDAVFFFKLALIIFEAFGFILVIKYYIDSKRKKGGE